MSTDPDITDPTVIEVREYNGDSATDLPTPLRLQIAKLIDDHFAAVQERRLEPFHIDVIMHLRELNTGAEVPPIRVIHVYASKKEKSLHPYIFEAAKHALNVRIRMTEEDLEHAATAS